jgi:hypothetical protein
MSMQPRIHRCRRTLGVEITAKETGQGLGPFQRIFDHTAVRQVQHLHLLSAPELALHQVEVTLEGLGQGLGTPASRARRSSIVCCEARISRKKIHPREAVVARALAVLDGLLGVVGGPLHVAQLDESWLSASCSAPGSRRAASGSIPDSPSTLSQESM